MPYGLKLIILCFGLFGDEFFFGLSEGVLHSIDD